MKLYTEEHLKLFYQLGKFDGIARRENDVEEEIKNHLPIELPSDEEIKRESKYKSNYILPQPIQFNPILNIVWIEGAIWMRDKIQGGNNDKN